MSKSDLEIGLRVRFRPTHNKALELIGTIVHKTEDGMVEVEAEPDGKAVEVAVNFVVDAADVKPVAMEVSESAAPPTQSEPPAEGDASSGSESPVAPQPIKPGLMGRLRGRH